MATISASRFVALLERVQSDPMGVDAALLLRDGEDFPSERIPTGPWDLVDLENPNDGLLIVTDSVDLRGRKLNFPVFVYGVQFRGIVDLREMTIKGGVDLTACIFDEDLRLDDTEIEGSLRLAGTAVNDLSMNGIIVHGRLDLRACNARKINMFDATVDGFVDLRSVSSRIVRLKGAHIRSDLRIGCGPDSGGNACRLGFVDASGSRIDGRINVDGCGYGGSRPNARTASMSTADQTGGVFRWPKPDKSLKGLRLDLSLAKVGGSLQVMAYYGQITHFDHARERDDPKIQAQTPVVWPILKRLDLTGAVIDGDVALLGTLVTKGIDARGVHIRGELRLLPGNISVKDSKKSSACMCRQTEIRAGSGTMGAVDLRVARVDGGIIIVGVHLHGCLDLSRSAIGSYMCVSGFRFRDKGRFPTDVVVPTSIQGDVLLYLATLENPLEFWGTHITGDLMLWGTVSPATVCLRPFMNLPTRVDGDVDLHSARILHFELTGAIVKGRVRLDGCEMLYFYARPGRLYMPSDQKMSGRNYEGPAEGWFTDDAVVLSEVGHLLMRNGNIAGDMALEYLQVTGRKFYGRCGVVIEDSKIGGSLLFFGEPAILRNYSEQEPSNEPEGRCPVSFRNFSATVFGGVQLKRSVVGAAVDMSVIKVDGAIDLEDSSVGGDLRFAAVKRSRHANNMQADESVKEHGVMNPAVCTSLNLQMLKCTNDVDLTGLVVVRNESDKSDTGCIDARYASVSGDLKCYELDRKKHNHPVSACVEHYFDVSYSQLAHLVISGNIFSNLPAGDAKRGLFLERAKVGKLEFRESYDLDDDEARSNKLKGSDLYPKPICLTDVNVEAWEVYGRESKGNDTEGMYINLLSNDEPFRRSTYRSLENNLRNKGDDHYADALFRAMHRREAGETRKQLKQTMGADFNAARLLLYQWHSLVILFRYALQVGYWFFFRYGTSPKMLFFVILFLFMINIPVYLTTANYESSLESRAVPTDRFAPGKAPGPDIGPHEDEWGRWDAIQVALKNHVPIVPLQVRNDWQPKDTGKTTWSINQGNCDNSASSLRCLPWPPEDHFNFIQVINWICWPILLTFYIRRLLRQ